MGYIEKARYGIEFLRKHTKFVFKGRFILILMFLAGIVNISLGIGLLTEDNDTLLNNLDSILKDDSKSDLRWKVPLVGSLMICVGLVLIINGFLGCYAAMEESRFWLSLFFGTVLVLFIAQVAGAALVLGRSVECDYARSKYDITKEYGNGSINSIIDETWAYIMGEGKACCGFCNYKDFQNSAFYDRSIEENTHHQNDNTTCVTGDCVDEYPAACCRSMDSTCTEKIAKDLDKVGKRTGCYMEIKRAIEDDFDFAARWALGVAVLEFCAMTISMILISATGSDMESTVRSSLPNLI